MVYSTGFPPEEGIGNYVWNLSSNLEERGHSVTLFTRGGPTGDRQERDGIEIRKVPFLPAYPFQAHITNAMVERSLDSASPSVDLLHVHSPLALAPSVDVPVISTFHTAMDEQLQRIPREGIRNRLFRLQGRVSRRVEAQLIRGSDLVTAASGSTREGLGSHGIDGEVRILPNGVDTTEFEPGGDTVEGRLLYTGRLGPRKGLPDLIEAASKLRSEGREFELVITGKGEERDQLESMVSELDLEDQVTFAGFVSKERLMELYHSAEVFVFPSHYEGLPTSILEAMASGLPIVTTTAPGVRDLVDHGEGGLVSDPGDADTFAENVERLMDDPGLQEKMGRENRRTAVDDYDWSSIAETALTYYSEIL